MEKRPLEVGNVVELHQAGMSLLERAREITARTGENAQGMAQIGNLLREMVDSEVLGELLAIRPGAKSAAVDVIAEHPDGSILSFYAMKDWQSSPSNEVHWHNYWQILLVVEGTWPDTVWRPVPRIAEGIARGVAIDRHECFGKGDLQTLGPDEPHGWLAGDLKSTEKATLLMWSGCARGRPRITVDPDTGQLTKEFGFLNPVPGEQAGSTISWSRY